MKNTQAQLRPETSNLRTTKNDEVRTYVDASEKMGKIVSIAVDGTAEVEVYIRNQARMAAGVGPVTVAVLMRNAKTAHMRQTQIGWRA